VQTVVILIPLLLLGGAAVNGLLALAKSRGAKVPDRLVSWLACGGPVGAFICTLILFGVMAMNISR
jgi:hypothetical protein